MSDAKETNETSVLQGMRDRMPWRVAMNILRDAGITPGRGWDRTIDKIKNGDESIDEAYLRDAFVEHVLCGEKYIKIHSVDSECIEKVRAALKNFELPESPAKKKFPTVLSADEVNDTSLGVTPIAINDSGDGIAIIFSSVRVFASKEPLTEDDLPEESQFLFDDFDEIVGFRNRRVQAFDVVWVPADGNAIECRIDFPLGMNKDIAEIVYVQLRKKLCEICNIAELGEVKNLFPVIKSIYDDNDEGEVVELGFATTTASIKHEKMRRQRNCLRKETYHVGGKAALKHDIEPFRLAVAWTRGDDDARISRPELALNGTSRAGASGEGILTSAMIRNCVGTDDYAFVQSRILHHLPSD